MTNFAIEIENDGDSTRLVRVAGELDTASVGQLAEALADVQAGSSLIVVDLRELLFIDSSGLHELARANASCRANGSELVLLKGPPEVHRAFETTGLDKEFTIFTDPDPEADQLDVADEELDPR